MLQDTAKDYSSYLKLNINEEIVGVQGVVDNMLTRLEELESVVNMIKLKNDDCAGSLVTKIQKYRVEITNLSKKIDTLEDVVSKVKNNVDILEKHIEKAENDFGISAENKLKTFFKPLLGRSKELQPATIKPIEPIQLESVVSNFVGKEPT